MTNYNDGLWHGWNGGDCPVHPETVVECICLKGVHTSHTDGDAGEWNWDDEICQIIAFRVIKEYREPREFWMTTYDKKYWNIEEKAKSIHERHGGEVIHVREVLE